MDTSTVKEGESGIQQKRTVIRYENGQEVARNTDPNFVVLKSPVNKEYRYGTNIVIRTLDTPDGPIEYWRKVRTYATSYSAATSGTPKTAKWYGVTATGLPMRKGIVAVDPSVISLGTKLYVPVMASGLAADTGGGVRGKMGRSGLRRRQLAGLVVVGGYVSADARAGQHQLRTAQLAAVSRSRQLVIVGRLAGSRPFLSPGIRKHGHQTSAARSSTCAPRRAWGKIFSSTNTR